MKRTISITLDFEESDLDRLLEAVYFGDDEAPKTKDLTEEQFALLINLLDNSADNFIEEIIVASTDAAANDWLCELTEQFE